MYNNKIIGAKGFVAYPDNLRDAKEFVEKYKSQALK
jgi:tetrahydromethanopterin S-methyltransferase subunit A